MAVISKIFKPRRGLASTMQGSKAGTVLADGEMFIEVQGTTVGKAKCKMKMGDGTTAYSSLPYAMGDTSSDPITFTPNSATTAETALASATSGATLATIVAAMKRAISLNAESITQLNDDQKDLSNVIGTIVIQQYSINTVNSADFLLYKNNKIVNIFNAGSIHFLSNVGAYSTVTLFNIPEAYRPVDDDIYIPIIGANGKRHLLTIHIDGIAAIDSWVDSIDAGTYLSANGVYIL